MGDEQNLLVVNLSMLFPIFLRKGEVGKIIYNTKGKLFYRFSENATNIQVSNGCYYTQSTQNQFFFYVEIYFLKGNQIF